MGHQAEHYRVEPAITNIQRLRQEQTETDANAQASKANLFWCCEMVSWSSCCCCSKRARAAASFSSSAMIAAYMLTHLRAHQGNCVKKSDRWQDAPKQVTLLPANSWRGHLGTHVHKAIRSPVTYGIGTCQKYSNGAFVLGQLTSFWVLGMGFFSRVRSAGST
jgi:hypothetical protein